MEDFIAMTKSKLRKFFNPNKNSEKINNSISINQIIEVPMASKKLNVTGAINEENHQATEVSVLINPNVTEAIDKENHETEEKKGGFIKKLKVLISDKQHIPKLIKELAKINNQLLKNENSEIDKKTKKQLRKEYDITLESNTLLKVISDKYETTPLLLAVKSNLTAVAKAILSMTDENLDIKDNEGMDVLHYAAKSNNKLTINTLLQKKVPVDILDEEGKTALHHAAENNCCSIVKTLLQHGANINALDKNGRTPYALIKNHSALADFMMKKGAVLEIKDKSKETTTSNEQSTLVKIPQANENNESTLAENHFDEQPTTSSEDTDEQSITSNSKSCNKELGEELEPKENCLEEDRNNKSTLAENLSSEQFTAVDVHISPSQENDPNEHALENEIALEPPIAKKGAQTPTYDETSSTDKDKHPWLPLRRVTKTKLPLRFHEVNKDKGAYKIAMLVASTSIVITASMLTYFTELPIPAIIGIAFSSALVFGSIAIFKPISKLDNIDCSKVCSDSKKIIYLDNI